MGQTGSPGPINYEAAGKEERYRQAWSSNPDSWDFPGGAVVKNPPANAGDTGSSPGLGRSHMPRSN